MELGNAHHPMIMINKDANVVIKMETNINVVNTRMNILPLYGHRYIIDLLKNARNLMIDTERETVKRGMRDVGICNMSPSNYDSMIDKITRDGLVFLPIQRTCPNKGYSHKSQQSPDPSQNTNIVGAIARDLDTAIAFINASTSNPKVDHALLGNMLGYPECCCKAFPALWETCCDPIYEIAKNTNGAKIGQNTITIEDADPNLYIHLRYFGMRIIPWFPCSFKCEESSKLAKKWVSVMQDIDPLTTNRILELICLPSAWDLLNSQLVVKHPHFMGRAISYYTDENKIVLFK